MKKIFSWLVLIFMGIAIPLLVLELGGRAYMAVKYGVAGKSYGLWRYDSEIGAVHRENAYNSNAITNDFGFRNREPVLIPKPKGSKRIIAYGGSTTFCYNLSNEQAWPLRLQSLLRSRGNASTGNGNLGKDQVLNAGAILWSLGHAYARARRDIPKLKPDYVLIYSGINEEANANFLKADKTPLEDYVATKQYGRFATNLDQNRWAKRNLFVVRLFDYVLKPMLKNLASQPNPANPDVSQNRIEQRGDEGDDQPIAAVEENYQKVLIDFLELINRHDGQAVFVAQAYGIDNSASQRIIGYSNRAMALAKQHGAIVINAQDMVNQGDVPREELFISTGVHYTEPGALKLAQFIYTSVFDAAYSNP